MLICYKGEQYNKVPLVSLSNFLFWKRDSPPSFQTLLQQLIVFDEYPVENFHSILQGQTRESDGSDMLQRKAKALDEIKSQASCFASVFDMPRKYLIFRDKLEDLKLSAAQFIFNRLQKIKENPGSDIIVWGPKRKVKNMAY